MGLAFRKLDVFSFKFVTAVKNINLLPNRDNVIAQKAKAFSNFALKVVTAIYVILFGLSFGK